MLTEAQYLRSRDSNDTRARLGNTFATRAVLRERELGRSTDGHKAHTANVFSERITRAVNIE